MSFHPYNVICPNGNAHPRGVLCEECREGFAGSLPGYTSCPHGVLYVRGASLRGDGMPCPACERRKSGAKARRRPTRKGGQASSL